VKYVKYYFTFTFFIAASNSAPSSILNYRTIDVNNNDLYYENNVKKSIVYFDTIYHYNYNIIYKNIKGTVYHAVPYQTDNTPLITADNSLIDTTQINKLRWVALSRNILNRKYHNKKGKIIKWNGKIKLGDTIYIDYDSLLLKKICKENKKNSYNKLKEKYEKIKGEWIVKDVMGEFYWKPEKNIKYGNLSKEMKLSGDYKYKNGITFIKVKQTNWIDFLQDHNNENSILDSWSERALIIKKKKIKSINIVKNEIPIDAFYIVKN